MMPSVTILQGDALSTLREMPSESVQMCVTSPPYWGLRDYGVKEQLGMEPSPEEYVENVVAVFGEVRRVLRSDGSLWLNLGDAYASQPGQRKPSDVANSPMQKTNPGSIRVGSRSSAGLKPKDLIGLPWLVAFALRADGWWLRSDIIWAKANCMPESVTDRPTRSHEYLFLLTKSAKYFYDHAAIKEPCIYDVDGTGTASRKERQPDGNKLLPTAQHNGIRAGGLKDARKMNGKHAVPEKQRGHSRRHNGFNDRWDAMEKTEQCIGMRNKRDVFIAPVQMSMMRSDLSIEQKQYVVAELLRRGII